MTWLCWQCGKKLKASFDVIEFNGSKLRVHKTCRKDADNLLLQNKVTFRGEESDDQNHSKMRMR